MSDHETSLREKILESSRDFLFNDGYSSLSMRKIASEVGVSATSIYLYFENKDHLVHTLIEESVDQLSSAIEKSAENAGDSIRKLESIAHGYVQFALAHPEQYQIIYMVQSEHMARYPKEKFRKARRGYALLESVIRDSIDEGLMEVEHPTTAAYSIWAQLHGVCSVVLNRRLDSRIDKNQFIKESLEHIIQGFLVRTTTS